MDLWTLPDLLLLSFDVQISDKDYRDIVANMRMFLQWNCLATIQYPNSLGLFLGLQLLKYLWI